jgi:hypothetical protein
MKEDFDETGHSKFAKSLLSKYKIGSLKDNDLEELQVFTKEQQAMYDKIDAKIDLTKALVPQLAKLTKEEYVMLMDRPVYLETTDSIKLYEGEWHDWFHRSDIDLNQKVVIPLAFIFFAIGLYFKNQEDKDGSVLDQTLFCFRYFLLGFVIWTAVEYQQHRFELHNEHTIPDQITEESIKSFFFSHHVHHMYSN